MRYYDDEEEYYEESQPEEDSCVEEEYGCAFCWDKKKNREFELYFFDRANNLRVCRYCPNCGRQYEQN